MATIETNEKGQTETYRVYEALKRDLLTGFFRPGEALSEARLSKRFGASRTPIREALLRLEADGLLSIRPRRGAYVHEPTIQDFLEVNELRTVLEPFAARLAASVIDSSTVADLQATLESIDVSEPNEDDFHRLYEVDRQMHNAIAESSGNSRLQRIINSLNDMMQVVRAQDMRIRYGEMHNSIAAILRALAERDEDEVENALREHISEFSSMLPRLVRFPGQNS